MRIRVAQALLSAAHAGSQLPGSTALALGEVLQQVRLDLDGGRVPLREQGHAERLIVQVCFCSICLQSCIH